MLEVKSWLETADSTEPMAAPTSVPAVPMVEPATETTTAASAPPMSCGADEVTHGFFSEASGSAGVAGEVGVTGDVAEVAGEAGVPGDRLPSGATTGESFSEGAAGRNIRSVINSLTLNSLRNHFSPDLSQTQILTATPDPGATRRRTRPTRL